MDNKNFTKFCPVHVIVVLTITRLDYYVVVVTQWHLKVHTNSNISGSLTASALLIYTTIVLTPTFSENKRSNV